MRTVIICVFTFLLASCSSNDNATPAVSGETSIRQDTITKLSCARLSKDAKGEPVISWVREVNDSTSYVCYSHLSGDGPALTNSVEITVSKEVHPHGENMPKLIFKPNGEIICMWGVSNPNPNSKYSGLVYYAQSFDNGKSWSVPIPLVKDTSAYDQRYFDMDLLPNGEAMVIWLDNRGKKDKDGSTLFCATTNSKEGFQNEKAIGETCCQCCRTDLFVDASGNVHASYRDIINDSIRDMVHIISTDMGKTFSSPTRISADNWVINGCPHTGPACAMNSAGMHFTWYTMGGSAGVFYCRSENLGKTFTLREVVSAASSAKHPQIVSLQNDNIVIVWDESVKTRGQVNIRIGFQLRDPQGKIIITEFISDHEAVSEFPVLLESEANKLLIAYTKRMGEKKSVVYKTVSF